MLETARNTRTDGRRDLVTELLGLWLVLAVFLDGWAHLNLPSLETFFTPWHAALYSGMLATAAWTAVVIFRNRAPGQPLVQSIPAGYRGTVVGLILFATAGGLDLLWHELLGIEVSLDALVSPTHLLLGFSLFLILGTAVRSARASHSASPGDHPALPPATLFAVVLMTGLGAFFLIYVSAFVRPGPTALFVPTPVGSPGRVQAELPVVVTLASYLLTTLLIIAPFLFTLSAAKRPVRGVVTLLVAAAAWLPVAMLGFRTYSIAGAAGATIAAVAADLMLARLPATWLRRRLPAVTGGIAAVLWTGQLLAFAVTDAIRWPVSLWLGAVVLSAAVAAGLALLSSWAPAGSAGSGARGRTSPRGSRLSPPEADAVHNDQVITLVKVLHTILFTAGYLAIAVVASVISYYGRPELGLGIILTATAMLVTLLIASAVVNRRQKRAVESAKDAEAAAAAGHTRTYSANVSESYEHDALTVWSLIRPAESAVLLSNAQRAFTVPGTPAGVGEQQCFIGRDGSVSVIEVIGEEGPWWATTRPISPGEMNSRSTYRLEPTSTGCTLTLGTVIELPANEVLAEDPDQWWETQMRPYLTRIKEVLAARQT